MDVKLFKWANVVNHCAHNKIMHNAFEDFHKQLKYCDWSIPNDIIRSFRTADIVNCNQFNRVVFNVGGNKYRLICGYKFGKNSVVLYVRFVGTHPEYDKVNACTVDVF